MRMVVRIRWGGASWKAGAALVLRLGGLLCFVTGAWIIAWGLRWAGPFLLEHGVFSHWQVWIAIGVVSQLAAFRLSRPNRQLIS